MGNMIVNASNSFFIKKSKYNAYFKLSSHIMNQAGWSAKHTLVLEMYEKTTTKL